jgi:hypothetical protein
VRVVYFHIRSFEGGSPRLCWLRTMSVAPCNMDWLCTDASVIKRDSVWATHRLPDKVFMWKMALGWGRTQSRLFYCHHERWPLMLPPWLMRVMLSGYFPLQGDYWFESLWHPQIWVKLVLWASNVDMRRCVWLIWGFLDDVDYFVVMTWCYIIYCMSYLCMLSIVANLLLLINIT